MFCPPLSLGPVGLTLAYSLGWEIKISLFLGQKHKLPLLDVEIWETLAQADDDHQVVERENIKW